VRKQPGAINPLHAEGKTDTMDLRRITDWTLLTGASIEIRQQGSPVCRGYVDAVTEDGTILWLRAPAQNRRLFEKAEFYEAWATEDRTGFHYMVTKGLTRRNEQTPANEDPLCTSPSNRA
jgi:hypothetical protein